MGVFVNVPVGGVAVGVTVEVAGSVSVGRGVAVGGGRAGMVVAGSSKEKGVVWGVFFFSRVPPDSAFGQCQWMAEVRCCVAANHPPVQMEPVCGLGARAPPLPARRAWLRW